MKNTTIPVIPTPEQMPNAVEEQKFPLQRDDVYNDSQTMAQRQQICFVCRYYEPQTMNCSECGCPIIMMSQFNFKQCPKGYW